MTRYCKKGRSKGCPHGAEHGWDAECPRDLRALRYYQRHITHVLPNMAYVMRSEYQSYNPRTQAEITLLLAFYTLQEEADATVSFSTRD